MTVFDEIRTAFLSTGSINGAIEKTGYNKYKVRRVLLTLGLWESRRSREIKALIDEGLSKEEICERLHLSMKGLESYMPYQRGAYLEYETKDTVYSKAYRERMRMAKDRQVAINNKIEEKGEMKVEFDDMKDLKVYKLRLELVIEDEEELEILRKYGKAENGISRTILAPSSMQLNRLNYAIQKCFGWENSHLHHFSLNDETFSEMTKGGDLEEWRKLAGIYFRCYDVTSNKDDSYYFDDYDGRRSFKNWLKRKYSEYSIYRPKSEKYEVVQAMASHLKSTENAFGEILYKEHPNDFKKPTKLDNLRDVLYELGGEELLERLELKDVLALDDEFYYSYDPGDGWKVRIVLEEQYENKYEAPESPIPGLILISLTEEHRLEDANPNVEGELREPVRKVMATLAPICLEADGYNVFDDVGGVWGFCEFLKGLKGIDNDHGYEPEHIEWARSLGWRKAMPKAEKIL